MEGADVIKQDRWLTSAEFRFVGQMRVRVVYCFHPKMPWVWMVDGPDAHVVQQGQAETQALARKAGLRAAKLALSSGMATKQVNKNTTTAGDAK